jgi:hypothetical protein
MISTSIYLTLYDYRIVDLENDLKDKLNRVAVLKTQYEFESSIVNV